MNHIKSTILELEKDLGHLKRMKEKFESLQEIYNQYENEINFFREKIDEYNYNIVMTEVYLNFYKNLLK